MNAADRPRTIRVSADLNWCTSVASLEEPALLPAGYVAGHNAIFFIVVRGQALAVRDRANESFAVAQAGELVARVVIKQVIVQFVIVIAHRRGEGDERCSTRGIVSVKRGPSALVLVLLKTCSITCPY